MTNKLLTIVTTTFNCIESLEGYLDSVGALDASKIDWIVVDGGSTDGTADVLEKRAESFSFFISEPDSGVYYGLNRAIAEVRTPYYLVLGADDRLSGQLLEYVLPLLDGENALILGAVRLVPGKDIKRPGPRAWHPIVWGRAVSHHSVGTVIRTDLHRTHGCYDTNYRVVADGAFLKKVLMSDEKLAISTAIFGDYRLGGISDRQRIRSIVETFMLQISAGSSKALQLLLLNVRLIKNFVRR